MGVRCTMLGHKYGDSEIEREREERGDEAIVTIREVRTCARCGDRSVVSENKEVSSVEPAVEDVTPAADPADAGSGAAGADPTAQEPSGAEAAGPDAADLDAADSGAADPEAAASSAVDDTADAPEAPERDPETDDGVILEDDDEDPEPEERGHGEWPDAEEDHGSAEADPVAAAGEQGPADWPDAEGDDEGVDASTPEADAPDVEYPLQSEDGTATDDRPAGGESGQSPDDSAFERAGEASSPAAPSTAGTELVCPSCGYHDPSRDGSLRGGDICPECKQGYLSVRD